ncbi:hypothetical protein WJ968_08135 [Achromobacter xylosoxidans]
MSNCARVSAGRDLEHPGGFAGQPGHGRIRWPGATTPSTCREA